jgi:precorrin-6B methylase 2
MRNLLLLGIVVAEVFFRSRCTAWILVSRWRTSCTARVSRPTRPSILLFETAESNSREKDAVTVGRISNNTATIDSSRRLSAWVVENLEAPGSSITTASTLQAGENDTLPVDGLCIGNVRVLAAESTYLDDKKHDGYFPVRLLLGRNGWGTGVHPTTRLCLDWICQTVQNGNVVLDYGCGSGILSVAALHNGARRCIGVDVEAEALVTASRNVQINGFDDSTFAGLHVREVLPYGLTTSNTDNDGVGVDVVVANILIGQLVRPSMVAAIVTNLAPGGLVCLSGIRPHEVDSLKVAYGEHMEWLDCQYAELSADETPGSLQSYGFDCGRWSRLVGRKTSSDRRGDIERMSELAVS